MDPRGQTAIITGGGSGLGEATARALAGAGAKVALLDLNFDHAQQAAASFGGLALQCDVASAEQAEAAIAEAQARLGPPRILVNCAGIGVAMKTLGRDGPHPLDIFRKVVEVNLIGTFNMIRLAAARMAELEPLADGERRRDRQHSVDRRL